MPEAIKLRFEWTCPHCGHRNQHYAPVTYSGGMMDTEIIYCDIEDGGCDQRVAVQPTAHVNVKVYKLIEVDPSLPSENEMNEAAEEANTEMEIHYDNMRRARERFDGLRRGMGLEE